MQVTAIEIIAAVLFAIAILHTFSVKFFEHLAHTRPAHAGLWHLLGEVEVVFGFWALILMLLMLIIEGKPAAISYIDSRNFTEPMFVFAIMVIAGTRPILQAATMIVQTLSKLIPIPRPIATYFTTLTIVPLLGSFITEPAAMTLAALMLREQFFHGRISTRFKYATLGVLFVNISIGGTLTPYAAPPVLMVAGKWSWGIHFMLTHFGWKAAIAVGVNALALTCLFYKSIMAEDTQNAPSSRSPVPFTLIGIHLLFLCGVVLFAHHSAIFMGLFLFFLGITHAYKHHQSRLILREGLLVAFFLAGLVVLGGLQQWWLKPLLMHMNDDAVFVGASILTAVTDNAALTYLGAQVDGLSLAFKYALVAGAVTGGGLTIIANAPNPAGIAILRDKFEDSSIQPLGLLLAALLPTLVAAAVFRFL